MARRSRPHRRRRSRLPPPQCRQAAPGQRWKPGRRTSPPAARHRGDRDDRALRRRAGVPARLRRRRAPDRAATHRVDRHGAVPRGGSRLLLDRPGRARPRRSAVRPARRSRRARLRPVVGRVPIVCASSSCPSTSGTTRSPATGCTTSPSATAGRRSPRRRFPGCPRSPPAASGRRSTTGATLRCCSIACGRAAPVSASTRRSRACCRSPTRCSNRSTASPRRSPMAWPLLPSDELRRRWRSDVERTIGPVDWDAMTGPDQQARRRRSDAFEPLLARITEVMRLDPAARW